MLSEGMISLGQSWAGTSSQFNLGDIYCTQYSKNTVLCVMKEIGATVLKELQISFALSKPATCIFLSSET